MTLAFAALFFGCAREQGEFPVDGKKVRVELNGAMRSTSATVARGAGEGIINPITPLEKPGTPGSGLPPRQLGIGIFTVEVDQPLTDPIPAYGVWGLRESVPYLDRGFFGGDKPGDTPDNIAGGEWNGNIEYTTRDGQALQYVFYEETGITAYYFVCFYPYDAINDIENTDDFETTTNSMKIDDGEVLTGEGATVYFAIDGSQDVMASTMGAGSINSPFGSNTNPFDESLVFSHKLVALRCNFIAENYIAKEICGDIYEVYLLYQPDIVGLNIGKQANDPTTPLTDERSDVNDGEGIRYSAVTDHSKTNPLDDLPYFGQNAPGADPDPVNFGYILAMPGKEYLFRLVTSTRKYVDVSYTFPADTKAGWVYDMTFNLLETAEVLLDATPIEEWWIDQKFD